MDVWTKLKIRLLSFVKKVKLFVPRLVFRIKLKNFNFQYLSIEEAVVIYMMCGKSTKYEAIATYFSIQRFHTKYFNVIILDDGTLNKSDEIQLRKYIKFMTLIFKQNADQLFDQFIIENPHLSNLSEMRNSFIFGPRLIDIHLVATQKRVLQLDTDVLFLDRPTFLLESLLFSSLPYLFNLDVKNSYSGELNEIYKSSKMTILERFNGGLSIYKSDTEELKFYSDMINLNVPKRALYYWEQTLFALMMTKNKAVPLPAEYDLHYRFKGYNSLDVISRHYCGDSRINYYFDYFKKVQRCSSLYPIQFNT